MTRSGNTARAYRLALLALGLLVGGCQSGDQGAMNPATLKLTLAVSPAPYSALIAIADEMGYFKEEGLEVALASHPSGREALEAVCAGQAEVATVADIAFAARILREPSLRVLASIGTTVGSQIVARKDGNIKLPSDLKGKKIGYSAGTVSDYFLYAFLLSENIPLKDVEAVDLPPARQAEAVVNGEVDAVSAFENFAYEARNRLGANGVSWQSQNNLAYHWLLVAREQVTHSPEPLERLVKAMIRAEEFCRGNAEMAIAVVADKWGYDRAFLQESWPRTRLTVSFGQSIVTSLQNYASWRSAKVGGAAADLDVLDFLDTGVLDQVDPARISLFR